MKKILMTLIAGKNCLDRFHRTVKLQARFPVAMADVDRLVITDRQGDPNVGLPIYRSADFWTAEGKVWFARLRNIGMRLAGELGYEWWIDGDADKSLIVPPTRFPDSGYACIPIFWAKKNESEVAIRKGLQANSLKYGGSVYFVVRRDVFTKHKFCEDYVGYGLDDIDYHENVLAPAGIHQGKTDARGAHLWHPPYRKQTVEIDRNKLLFRRRQVAVGRGNVRTVFSKDEASRLDRAIAGTATPLDLALLVHGSTTEAETSWLTEKAKDKQAVILIGARRGRSAVALASNPAGKVFVVDHPQALQEYFWIPEEEIKNRRIVPVACDPAEFPSRVLPLLNGRTPGMIVIDGARDHTSVKQNLVSGLDMASPGTLLCGMGYSSFPEVKRAVAEAIPGHEAGPASIWWWEVS